MRARIAKIRPIVFACAIVAVASSALADLPERRFIQTLHPQIEELPQQQAALGFGNDIQMQGDLALVGDGGDSGHVAVFTREDRVWRRTGSLQCPRPICGPLSLEDDVAVVQAYDMVSGLQTLSIFRHEQGTWTLTDSIPKPLPDLPDLWTGNIAYHNGILAVPVGPTFSKSVPFYPILQPLGLMLLTLVVIGQQVLAMRPRGLRRRPA